MRVGWQGADAGRARTVSAGRLRTLSGVREHSPEAFVAALRMGEE